MKTKKANSVDRVSLVKFLNTTMKVAEIADVSCNGLQVQGTETISKIALAVDACMDAYVAAKENEGTITSSPRSIPAAINPR